MSSIIRTVLKPFRRRSERDVLALKYKSIITLAITDYDSSYEPDSLFIYIKIRLPID